jgi:hypothetical protein
MLKIITHIKDNVANDFPTQRIDSWLETYAQNSFNWSFKELDGWIETQENESTKTKLKKAIETFKTKLSKKSYNKE